jgi:hypothetical protein
MIKTVMVAESTGPVQRRYFIPGERRVMLEHWSDTQPPTDGTEGIGPSDVYYGGENDEATAEFSSARSTV